MMILRALMIALAGCSVAPAQEAGVPAADIDTTLVISRIVIENGDVIPPWSEEAGDRDPVSRFGYRAANFLHIRTRKQVIQREILFAPGDSVRLLDIAETERNLRSYGFINGAAVQVVPTGDGYADMHVRTSDNFSFAPGLIFEGGGGTTQYGVILTETNFLGMGKRIAGEYLRETGEFSSTTWLAEYKDPRVLGSRWYLHGWASSMSSGTEYAVAMTHPFYRLTTPNAGGWSLDVFDGFRRRYRNGYEVAHLPSRWTVADAWYAHRWGEPAFRLKARGDVLWRDIAYSGSATPYAGSLPVDTLRVPQRSVTARVTLGAEGFASDHGMRRLDDFSIVEDVRTGWEFGLTGGVGLPSEPTDVPYGVVGIGGAFSGMAGGDATHVFAADARFASRIGHDSGDGRRGWSNLVADAWAHWYYRGLPAQTIATSINWQAAYRSDPPFQLLLGGSNGLRGYPTYQFQGTRRLLVNVEDRIFTSWRVFTGVFGFVVFADAGYVWDADDAVNLGDLRSDVGFGLRVGNTRAATSRISRFDVAFRLRGQRGVFLAFGSEQMFDLFNVRPTPTR